MSDIVIIFTSTNTNITANNNPLGFVQAVDVEDTKDVSGEKYTSIVLHRLVNDNEDVINDMRSGPFLFKILNASTGSGYIATEAEVIGFKMHLAAKKDINPVEFLEQTITIKAKSFLYVPDARSVEMKMTEETDLVNLIKIIKENQAKSVSKAVLPTEIAVPDEDLVWLNAKDPEQLEGTRPRKIKKNKKRS